MDYLALLEEDDRPTRPWLRRLLRHADRWEDLGWAEGIKQIVEVLPDPGDDSEG